MLSLLKPSTLRLTTRLFLINLMTAVVLSLIAVMVIIFFTTVENKVIEVTNNDMESLMINSHTSRKLSGVFSDIDYLNQAFLKNDALLLSEGKRLTDIINSIQQNTANLNLRDSLLNLSDQYNAYLAQCAKANTVLHSIENLDRVAELELTKLENLLGDSLVESSLSGKDTSYIKQQLTLVIGYRESLLYIAKLFSELGLEFFAVSLPEDRPPIILAIDDLALRLQTLTASFPKVAKLGRNVESSIQQYREQLLGFYTVMDKLNSQREAVQQSKSRVLSIMENIDKKIALTVQQTGGSIQEIVFSSMLIVSVLIIILILVLIIVTAHLVRLYVKQPMREILNGIKLISQGNFDTPIRRNRKDEWDEISKALNYMASELHESYKAIITARDKLEDEVDIRTDQLSLVVGALSKSESNLLEAQKIAHLGYWSCNNESGISEWSTEQFRIFGYVPFEVNSSYDLFASHIHPQEREQVLSVISEAIQQDTHFSTEFRIIRQDGSQRWIEAQGRVLKNENGQPTGVYGTSLDTTQRKLAENLLQEERERAIVTLHSIGDAVISTDADGRVEYLNPVAEKLTGYTLDEATGRPLEKIFHIINEETREKALNPVDHCLEKGEIVGLANHTVMISKSGMEHAIQDSAAPIKNQSGKILGVVLVFNDVTEQRALSKQMSYQACHDMLTGLINRREFELRLKRVLETAKSSSTENALCFLDLDQFKLVNDTCGHVAGDELLRQIGVLLNENVRHRDTLARLGGDEFGLLMEHCSLKEAEQLANKLVKAISEFNFLWENQLFKIGVSIGLISVDHSSEDIELVMSAADSACYMAKDNGRNRVHVYHEDDEELTKRQGEMQWAVLLPRALEENRFQLYLQPIKLIENNQDEGDHFEVLLRMKDVDIVLPNAFLPAADRYHFSSKLDRWVITYAFTWLVDHPENLERLHLFSINLSGHSLNDETFLDFVHREFEKHAIPPHKICFEITETVAIANLSRTTKFMNALKSNGCLFSLDDFGSGLSSYAYLKNLPVDFLKIDGLFVKDILDDPLDLAMVKSINEIGHVMGKKTIAEFVENEAILQKLREIGVDYAQGFGIHKPRPIDELKINH